MGASPAASHPLPPAADPKQNRQTERDYPTNSTAEAKGDRREEEVDGGHDSTAVASCKAAPRSARYHAGMAAQTGLRGPNAVEKTLVRFVRILSVLLQRSVAIFYQFSVEKLYAVIEVVIKPLDKLLFGQGFVEILIKTTCPEKHKFRSIV